ncbi:MAG: carbohydrate binding domain-containing protein [Thermoguttaceae bacterium]|jgi:hypothetical protein
MQIKRLLTTLIASSLVVALGAASATFAADTMFPFVIEKGAPENITNVRTWDGVSLDAAGADGHIVAKNGEFWTKSGKMRLLGTNTCFAGSFCSHEKAERLADTLSRFGIGVVRLHHMDAHDIWGKNFAKGTTEIDPDQLDKLDYLISCFKKKGIYVNINLHVSRAFREIDGFENANQLPTQNKGVDNFDRRMIELQKKYAKDLLTHVNPYTGMSYVDDPCVAVVEINNENSVVASWSWGELDTLPEPYAGDFKQLWNDWLLKKYQSTAKLRDAWNCKSYPLGAELAQYGVFDDGFKFNADRNWNLETDAKCEVSYRVLPPEESGLKTSALRFEVAQLGEVDWRPQFHYVGLSLESGKPYQVAFKVRADKKNSLGVSVKENHDPWENTGLADTIDVDTQWKDVKLSFTSPVTDDSIRLTFNGFSEGDAFELADVSFREGGDLGFDPSLTLEKGEIPVLKGRGSSRLSTAEALADFTLFLHDIENDYWQEMYSYVKGLGVKSLTTGTQLQYGFWYNQGRLDYCDIHAYWNHPTFPRRQWDGNDWYVRNTCLANSPNTGTLANLSALRVVGKPFTCSEYDHPFPNTWCAEGNVMLAAVAAFQDWSATFQFAWSHNDDYEREVATPFFDMCTQPVKIAHLPACYGAFVRGDVKAGPGQFVYAPTLTEAEEIDVMTGLLHDYHRSLARGMNLDPALSLAVFSGVELTDLKVGKNEALANAKPIEGWSDLPAELGNPDKKEIVNEFGEVKWNWSQEGQGYFVVDTARTKIFSGFTTAPCAFDGITLDVGETMHNWATISLVKAKKLADTDAKDGKLSAGSYLLTATGDMRNTDSVYKETSGNAITTAGHFGGSNGVAPVLCEGIPATMTLAGLNANNVVVYALDNAGARSAQLDVAGSAAGAVVTIGPEYKTIWYEIVVK